MTGKQITNISETVLVTGGTGFVAGWCIAELLNRNFTVRTTVRNLSKEQAIRAAISTAADPRDRLTFFTADLTSDAGWDEAVAGCDYVLHVASPLGRNDPKNPEDLITPARDGALRVLKAATKAGVKRVVMTSACAAASPSSYKEEGVTDESLWTDPENPNMTAYMKSKVLAEKAAWQFMNGCNSSTTLTTILPGAVFGPLLYTGSIGSVQVIGRLMQGKIPGTPRIGFEIVDVRDLAEIHIRAMTAEAAAGQRVIAVGEYLWMADMAKILRARLGSAAAKVPKRNLPDFLMKTMALFDPTLRTVTPSLGRKHRHTPERAKRMLNWKARPAADTIVDCAKSLIDLKVI